MTAPEPVPLGPADAHRRAAENAAAHGNLAQAAQERYRAVIRGLEQDTLLPTDRARTARETADAVAEPGFAASATAFDEIVYGARPATNHDLQVIASTDRYGYGPAALDRTKAERRPSTPRTLPGSPQLWFTLAATLLALFVGYLLLSNLTTPHPPSGGGTVDLPDPPPDAPDRPADDFSLLNWGMLTDLPPWARFGLLQVIVTVVLLALWRARRRGALAPAETLVRTEPTELLHAHAQLLRHSRDTPHVAQVLRNAALRRILPRLGLTTSTALPMLGSTSGDQLIQAIAGQLDWPAAQVSAILYGPTPDQTALLWLIGQLDMMEGSIRIR